jgi:hypothetical protein
MMEFMQYDYITDVIEDDLDCLSVEALLVELFVEDELEVASWAK